MNANTYIKQVLEVLAMDTRNCFYEWGKVISDDEHTDDQLRHAEINYFKASAAEDTVRYLYLELLVKGLI